MFANGGSAHPDWSVQWWGGSSWSDALGISQSNGVAYSKIAPAAGDASTNLATTAWVGQNDAGGFRNHFRNPTFDVHQRGASGTVTAGTPAYTADGWIVSASGVNASWTAALTGLQSGGGTVSASCLRVLCASGLTGLTIKQRIESVIAATLSMQGAVPITVQFSIYNNTASPITPTLTVNFANSTDNFSAVTVETHANGVSFQTIAVGQVGVCAYTFTPSSYPNGETGYEVIFGFGGALNAASGSIYIGLCDIRATPGAATNAANNNPPPPEVRPIGAEMPFCQRYYQATTTRALSVMGGVISSDVYGTSIVLSPPMRTAPTLCVHRRGHGPKLPGPPIRLYRNNG